MKYPIENVQHLDADMHCMLKKNTEFVLRILASNKNFFKGKKSAILNVANDISNGVEPGVQASKSPVTKKTRKPCCIFANVTLGRRGSEFFKCKCSKEPLITCKGIPVFVSEPNQAPQIGRYGKRHAMIRA